MTKLSLDEAHITVYDDPEVVRPVRPALERVEAWCAQADCTAYAMASDLGLWWGSIVDHQGGTILHLDGPRKSEAMAYEGLLARLEQAGEVVP